MFGETTRQYVPPSKERGSTRSKNRKEVMEILRLVREGKSQGMRCVADLENNQPIEQEIKSPGDNPPDQNKKQKNVHYQMAFEKLLEEMGRLSQSFVHGILRRGEKKEASINHVEKTKVEQGSNHNSILLDTAVNSVYMVLMQ